MNIPVWAVSVLSLSCVIASAPALAGSAKLRCSVVEESNQYQLRVENPGKKSIPSGATVHAKIAPKKIKGIDPKTVNVDFTSTLTNELATGGSTEIKATPFAKSCTANATW